MSPVPSVDALSETTTSKSSKVWPCSDRKASSRKFSPLYTGTPMLMVGRALTLAPRSWRERRTYDEWSDRHTGPMGLRRRSDAGRAASGEHGHGGVHVARLRHRRRPDD